LLTVYAIGDTHSQSLQTLLSSSCGPITPCSIERLGALLQGLEVRDEQGVGLVNMLRNHADLTNHSHVIGIAFPAWHNMDMEMFGNTRPGGRAEVETNVKTIRTHSVPKHLFAAHGEFAEFGALAGLQGRE